jgi:cytochrome oxidase Cu insertion factor (SCO1/SenC/PrrC family)
VNIVLGFFAAFTVLNFILILGLLRQSRRQSELISELTRARVPNNELLPRGTKVSDFAVTAADGAQRSLADFAGAPSLFGFFVVHCPPCEAKIPEFKAYVRRAITQGAGAMAVVTGEADVVADYVRELGEVMPVVVQAPGGPVLQAFSVASYPSFFALDPTGRVWSSGPTIRALAQSTARQAQTSDVG